jgi:hypothetical protein
MLEDRVDADFFENLAKGYLEKGKYHEAALIVDRFKFYDKFDCKLLVEKLAEAQRLPIAKMICRSDVELRDHLINCLTTNENCKGAA